MPGKRNADFADTGPDSLIRAVEIIVSIKTAVQFTDQLFSQSVTHGESSASKSHTVRVHHVLLYTLRVSANVPHLAVVVFRQYRDEILGEINRIVVSQNEPSRVLRFVDETVPDDSGDTNRRSGAREFEFRPIRRRNAIRNWNFSAVNFAFVTVSVLDGIFVEPDESTCIVVVPPLGTVNAAILPRFGGGADAEDDVGDVCGRRIGFAAGMPVADEFKPDIRRPRVKRAVNDEGDGDNQGDEKSDSCGEEDDITRSLWINEERRRF